MSEKRKIGCVIAYQNNNYGTFLQGYATIKKIRDLNFDCEVIHYVKKDSLFLKLKKAPFLFISGGCREYIRKVKKKWDLFRNKKYAKNKSIRVHAVNQCKKEKIEPYVKRYIGFSQLKKGSLNYDVVLVGSDQIWTPLGLYSQFYNLMFVADQIPKVSYASSFGVSKIPFWQKRATKKYLDRLDRIGVRELKGKQIVDTLSNNTAKIVVDPTLLITKEEWENELLHSQISQSEPYIFCYVLGGRKEIRNAILELKEKTGLKVVYLRHLDDYIGLDNNMGDETPYNVSPFDFINYIKNATYVCTDSFHGTVFSILFQKQFITFHRYISSSSNSRNSRIESLFQLFQLDRLYKGDVYHQMITPIHYEFVVEKLKELRNESLHFLKECLSINK